MAFNYDQKLKFIELRAAGNSYNKIAKEMNISKDTCFKWENELQEQIASLKAEQLSTLYDTYHMYKEDRIKKVGDTLKRIDDALAAVDLSGVPPEKLLDYKLKYETALNEEYIPLNVIHPLKDRFDEKDVLSAFSNLLNRVQCGEVTLEQANRETTILSNMLKAFEDIELKKKIEQLESLITRSR